MSKKYNLKKGISNAIDVCIRWFGRPDKLIELLNDTNLSYDELTNTDSISLTPTNTNNVVDYYNNNKIDVNTYSTPLTIKTMTPPDVEFIGLYTPPIFPSSITGATYYRTTAVTYLTVENNGDSGMTDHKVVISFDSYPGSSYYPVYKYYNNGLIDLVPGHTQKTIPIYWFPSNVSVYGLMLNKHNISYTFYSGKTIGSIYTNYKYATIIKDSIFDIDDDLRPDIVVSASTSAITNSSQTYTTTIYENNKTGANIQYLQTKNNYNWVGYISNSGWSSVNNLYSFDETAGYDTFINLGNYVEAYGPSVFGSYTTISNAMPTINNGTPVKVTANFIDFSGDTRLRFVLANTAGNPISNYYPGTSSYISGLTGATNYEFILTTTQSSVTYHLRVINTTTTGYQGFKVNLFLNNSATTITEITGSTTSTLNSIVSTGIDTDTYTITPYNLFTGATYKSGICTVKTEVYDRPPFNIAGKSFTKSFTYNF
jgi:hypothetical protein